jgi:hypothetical protein
MLVLLGGTISLPTALSLLVLVALLVVPGAAAVAVARLRERWLQAAMSVAGSLTVLTTAAVLMLWTGTWYPRPAAAVLLLVAAGALLLARPARTGLAGPGQAVVPSLMDPAHPRTAAVPWPTVVLIVVALALWAHALLGTDLDAMTATGLLGVLPRTYYMAVLTAVGLFCWGVASDRHVALRCGGGLLLLLLLMYGTSPLVEDAPRLPWVYKHIGVTEYILANSTLDPGLDLYHRWPGFFGLTALLSSASGLAPTALASWSELGFALVETVLVLAVARGLVDERRYAWTAAVIFTLANWVGQNYFAPQALGFALYLAVWALLLRLPRGARTPRSPTVRRARQTRARRPPRVARGPSRTCWAGGA